MVEPVYNSHLRATICGPKWILYNCKIKDNAFASVKVTNEYIHKNRTVILYINQIGNPVMTVQLYFTDGESKIDWGNEFQSLIFLLL